MLFAQISVMISGTVKSVKSLSVRFSVFWLVGWAL